MTCSPGWATVRRSTDGDIVGPAIEAEDVFHATCLAPSTGATIRTLAELGSTTLALMHGPAYTGDNPEALTALAAEYDRRVRRGRARLTPSAGRRPAGCRPPPWWPGARRAGPRGRWRRR